MSAASLNPRSTKNRIRVKDADPEAVAREFLNSSLPLQRTQPSGVKVSLAQPKPSEAYDTFWLFAFERQNLFFKRIQNSEGPWTEDIVLQKHRFTNAYRASDRVSQYLIQRVIYDEEWDEENLFLRILLFKFFNRISTWTNLNDKLGRISKESFHTLAVDPILTELIDSGEKIFSAAYIMPTGGRNSQGMRKHTFYLELLSRMLADGVPERIAQAKKFQDVYEIIKGYPMMGPFLAYQYAIDINYSPLTNFGESEWVMPGPGALDGISKCFEHLGDYGPSEVIEWLQDRQEFEFSRLGLEFKSLWGRPLQLIDCQNLLCEVSKYTRVTHPHLTGTSGRSRIKQDYRPHPDPLQYWYPPNWGLNATIANTLTASSSSEAPHCIKSVDQS